MPAKSKKQQRFMGMVHATQKGELKDASSEVKKVAKDIDPEDAGDFAATKHKGLPDKKTGGKKDENMTQETKKISLWNIWKEHRVINESTCSCKCKSCVDGNCSECTCDDCDCDGCSC